MAHRVTQGVAQRGQVLVMFVLFLLVLLGISALAIDYASWLLTDRTLQNHSDHAALAGASGFGDRTAQATCSGGSGAAECLAARALAWASLNNELALGMSDQVIGCLAAVGSGDSPAAGETDSSRALSAGCTNDAVVPFGHTIWVSTPPPDAGRYKNFGGAYSLNFGVVWVRVDREVRSFLGGALGIVPDDRTGWSTAGSLPTDFALQVFCRDHIAPQNGVCVNSAGLAIDGQGGIRLIRGDIASNESLKVTAQGGQGVILEAGNQYLVNGVCSASTWNCPASPPLGGISDGVNGKNAFYMAPLPVPRYASPLDDVTVTHQDCQTAGPSDLCVPNRPHTGSNGAGTPGDWVCAMTGFANLCGTPTVTTISGSSTVSCAATLGGTPSRYLVPANDGSGMNAINGTPENGNRLLYTNIDDSSTAPDNDTTSPPGAVPTDYVYLRGTLRAGRSSTVTFSLRPPFGIPGSGSTTISYNVFRTNGINIVNDGNATTVTVSVLQNGVVVAGSTDTTRTLDGTPALYTYTVNGITDFTDLALQFRFDGGPGANADARGGGIGFAQAYTQELSPALPALIPPGYYHSITIPDGGCAIMDPTAQYYGYSYPALAAYTKPGIYRFGTGNDAAIDIGDDAFLIGDGVTLVFDPEFPDPTGGRGIILGANGALVLNTARISNPAGSTPCTPYEEVGLYNPSDPFPGEPNPATRALPYSSVCAAWGIDPTNTPGVYPGSMAWPVCIDTGLSQCVDRSAYSPTQDFRGITFYFTPSEWPGTTIRDRFEMGGGAGAQPGIVFRGVLYAPYDNVKISGGNGFNTVGQVLAWSAKFNGGNAYIDLDYPYQFIPAPPYLLEPTINR